MITDLYYRKALVFNVVDGDTFDARVDLGFDVATFQRFRILGIDAPEINTSAGKVSREKLAELIHGKEVVIQSVKSDSFGRYLASVHIKVESETVNVANYMIQKGLAIIYTK